MFRHLYLGIALVVLVASPSWAQIAHRYSFTSDASDSVGSADGIIVDAGTTANFAFSAGQLDFSANTAEPSNAIVEDAYVDLPNGTISSSASAGKSGQLAIEWWGTVTATHTWQRAFDFGESDGGEDASPGAGGSAYIMGSVNSGRHGDGLEITNHAATGGEPNVGVDTLFANGVQQQIFAVYNHDNPRSGSNGTMSLYLDGALVGHAAIDPNFDVTTFNDVNNWLGRSQWPDPVFQGMVNEVRIYDQAPSDDYVQSSFNFGPESVPSFDPWVLQFDLGFEVDRDTGTFTLSNSGPTIDVVGITVSSNSGALVPANLLSVTDNYDFVPPSTPGSFDTDDQWQYRTPTTEYILDEFEQIGDGGQLGIGGTLENLQLGDNGAWTPSQYEDLVVTVQRLLPDFTVDDINVPVTFVGGLGAAPARSDLDEDGDVDIDDYLNQFVPGHLTDLSALTPATAWKFGDLDGDLDNDYQDFLLIQQDYDAANGVGAFAAMLASVPEPSSLTLILATCAPWIVSRRRRL